MNFTVNAPGKLILIGEYAVLEGAPSLVMAVDRHARVDFKDTASSQFILHSPTLDIFDLKFALSGKGKLRFDPPLSPAARDQLTYFIQTVELLTGVEKKLKDIAPCEITLDTGDFFLEKTDRKLGLGSSAALTVALLYGLLHRANPANIILTRPSAIFEVAQQIHHTIQGGKGSGIDIAASSFGGMLFFQKNRNVSDFSARILSVTRPPDLHITAVWSGKSTSTPQLVGSVSEFKKSQPDSYWRILNQMQEISREACLAFQAADSMAFMERCQQYNEALSELGEKSHTDIISENHRRIAAVVQKAGGIYKPSGAGGGDIGMAFAASASLMDKVIENLWHSGYQTLNLGLSKSGVQLAAR